MTVDDWYAAAVADAKRRGRPELEGLLMGLRAATAKLRAADFVDDASGAAAPRAPRTPATPGTPA